MADFVEVEKNIHTAKSWRWEGKVFNSVTDDRQYSSSSSSFSTCSLLGTTCFGIRTKLPQLHSNRFWLPSFGVSLIQKRTDAFIFPYFEFGFIYFVRSFYKTVKKEFYVCKIIFFIWRSHRQAEWAILEMAAMVRWDFVVCIFAALTDSTLL